MASSGGGAHGGDAKVVDGDGPRRARLPVPLTTFVGRDVQVAELAHLLQDQRLVTVTGPGGCGKTRLAVEVLSREEEHRREGVGWVDLATVTDPTALGEVVAGAMGVRVGPGADAVTSLAGVLRDSEALIGFDNCEHVVDDCGEVVERLLVSCPGVTVLATSREPLGVPGEVTWRVPPMADADVVALFEDRARAARADFRMDGESLDAVRTICRRLDGIPLAAELAAAWVRVFTTGQIAAGLDDRFGLLVGGPRRAVERHRTLLASIEWSYNLLGHDAQVLLRRAAVFAGDFDVDAAVEVCGGDPLAPEAVVAALSRLVDTSMVTVVEQGDVARYRLLESIRQFGVDQLVAGGELAGARARHLAYFLAVAEEVKAELSDGDQDAALVRASVDLPNLLAAMDWGLSADDATAARRIGAALVRVWFLRGGAREGLAFLQRAVEADRGDASGLQAELLSGLALLAMPAGRLDLNEQASRQALDLARRIGDDRAIAMASASGTYVAFFGDYERLEELGRAAQEHGEAAGETFASDVGLLMQAIAWGNRDHHDDACALVEQLHARCAPRNDRFCAAFTRNVMAYRSLLTGDVRRAIELGQEAVAIAGPLQDYFTSGTVTAVLAWAHGVAGELERAHELMDTLVSSVEAAGPDVDVVDMRVTVGRLHLWAGDLEDAVVWLSRAAELDRTGADNWTVMHALPCLAGALRRLGRVDEARAAAERGVAMAERLGTPHAHAESLDELAHLIVDDDLRHAESLHYDALNLRVAHRLRTHTSDSLDALANIAIARGNDGDAARLLAASDAARSEAGYPRPAVDVPRHEETVAALRTRLGHAAFEDLSSEGAALSLDAATAYVMRARGPRSRPTVGWASLTPTEREVVALVTEGLTNADMAKRLFVSHSTVKTHLSHIYAKVGVPNRAALAALAYQQLEPGP